MELFSWIRKLRSHTGDLFGQEVEGLGMYEVTRHIFEVFFSGGQGPAGRPASTLQTSLILLNFTLLACMLYVQGRTLVPDFSSTSLTCCLT